MERREIAAIGDIVDTAPEAIGQRLIPRFGFRDQQLFGTDRQPCRGAGFDRLVAARQKLFVAVLETDHRLAVAAHGLAGPALENIHIADEIGDEARIGIFVDLARRRNLRQRTLVHEADARGDRHRLFLVMGDDDEGGAGLFLDVHQLELRLLAQLGVECAERFVEQEQLRILGERTGERHALALAAGKLVRLAFGEILHLHQLQHLGGAVGDLPGPGPRTLQAEGDVVLDG
jgi:hypothetical protein